MEGTKTQPEPFYIYKHTVQIPCDYPERHAKKPKNADGQCLVCLYFWLQSLPWHERNSLNYGYDQTVDDEVIRRLKLPEACLEKQRHIFTIKDCWKNHGKKWEGYTCEIFGIRCEELDFSPYRRLEDSLVRTLRIRICYEPQKVWFPVFLEILINNGRSEISIERMDSYPLNQDRNMSSDDLNPLIKAQKFYYKKYRGPGKPPDPDRKQRMRKFAEVVNQRKEIAEGISEFARRHSDDNWLAMMEHNQRLDYLFRRYISFRRNIEVLLEAAKILYENRNNHEFKRKHRNQWDHAVSAMGVAQTIAMLELSMTTAGGTRPPISTLNGWYKEGGGCKWKMKDE